MRELQTEHITLSDGALQAASLNKNFEERSELTQEIISSKHDFFEKWSLLVFLILLVLLMFGTWFVKYPDIVQANAILTGSNTPKEIIPKQTGKLTALFVKNNQYVKQDAILGWLESNADTKEIIDLATRLESSMRMLGNGNPQSIAGLFKRRFTNLGEIQVPYQTFITVTQQYNDYLANGFYSKRKKMLYSDIASLQNINGRISAQKKLTAKDNALTKSTFEMNKKLYDEKVISAEEYQQAQSRLLNKKLSLPQVNVNMISQQNQIRNKQKEIDQLNHDILQQQQTFEQALQTLKGNVEDWLRRYTIQAPTDGVVVFTLPLQQNQYVAQGKLLGYVSSPDSKCYAEVKLAQINFGKVDTGMKVQLRLDAYPYQETGFIPGTLTYISNVAIDSGFLGTVRLDKGLTTNQNKTIQYKTGLKAQALIITKDMRLLERLYYSIIKATSVNK